MKKHKAGVAQQTSFLAREEGEGRAAVGGWVTTKPVALPLDLWDALLAEADREAARASYQGVAQPAATLSAVIERLLWPVMHERGHPVPPAVRRRIERERAGDE